MKQRIKLTESDLHNMVKESLNRVLLTENSKIDNAFAYIAKPYECNLEKDLIPADKYKCYNNENLLNKPDLMYWLNYCHDDFAGVTKDGEVYTDYFPNISIGNIYRDKYYKTVFYSDRRDTSGGYPDVLMFIHPDNTCTVCCGSGIYSGKLYKVNNDKYIVHNDENFDPDLGAELVEDSLNLIEEFSFWHKKSYGISHGYFHSTWYDGNNSVKISFTTRRKLPVEKFEDFVNDVIDFIASNIDKNTYGSGFYYRKEDCHLVVNTHLGCGWVMEIGIDDEKDIILTYNKLFDKYVDFN